jgi:serine/threonine protein kinase
MAFVPPSNDEIRQVLTGVQQLTPVGDGGFKVVYKATLSNGVDEALKLILLPPDPDESASLSSRVEREVRVLKNCSERALVKLASIELQSIKIGSRDFLAYSEEYLLADDLKKIISERRRLSGNPPLEQELKHLARTLAVAVKEIANQKCIHRDIKPGNVMKLTDPSRPFVLLDLGLAFDTEDSPITANPNAIPGTPIYFSPEMLGPNFRNSIDYRSDLYAVGTTIYEYATGAHPLHALGNSISQTYHRILKVRPSPLQTLRPDLSSTFCVLIDKMLRKRPALRPNLDEVIALTSE